MQAYKYGSYGPVRGYGPLCDSLMDAEKSVRQDGHGCARQGGYSDRQIVAVDQDGYCYRVDDTGAYNESDWIRSDGGSRGARYDLPG